MTIKEVKEKYIDKYGVKAVTFLYTNEKLENKSKSFPVEEFLKGNLEENYPSLDKATFTVQREECEDDDGDGVYRIKTLVQLMIRLAPGEKNAFDYEKTIKTLSEEIKDNRIEREDYWNGAKYIAEFYKRPWDYKRLVPTILKSFGEKDTYFKGVRFPFGTPLRAKYYALAFPQVGKFGSLLDEVVVQAYWELVELAKTHPENLKTMARDELDNLLAKTIEEHWDSLLPLIEDDFGVTSEEDLPDEQTVFDSLEPDFFIVFYHERAVPRLDGLFVSDFSPIYADSYLSVLDCFRLFDRAIRSKYPMGAIVEITIEVEADGTMSSSTTFVTKYDFRLGSSVPVEDFIEYAQKGGKEACWTIDLEKH